MPTLLAFGLTAEAAGAAWSFTTSDPRPIVWCRWPLKPTQVDGRLDEWRAEDFQVWLDEAHLSGNCYADPRVQGGDADCSGRVAFTWDGTWLYVAAQVRDDVPARLDPGKGFGEPWTHDGLMLHLHAHPGLERTGRYGPEYRSAWADSCALLGLTYHQEGMKPRELPGRSRYAAARTETGYALEAAIELAALGYRQPLPGDRLKLALILVDNDPGATGADAFGQLIYELGPFEAKGNPHDWADLRLLRDGWGADAIGCVQGPPSAQVLRVKGTLDAEQAEVVFRGIRVVDATGRVVHEAAASQPVPRGRRLAFGTDLALAKAPDVAWAIHVLAAVAGQVQDHGPATQVEGSATGPVGDAPRPVYVPNASRWGLSARYYRPVTLKAITRDTYLDFLKEHAPRKLQPLMETLKRPWAYAQAPGFLAAYMYAVTREPFYAETARAALESAIGWIKAQDKQGAVHTHDYWLMVKFMREGGLLTAADEPRLREFLVEVSQRACRGAYEWDQAPWRRGAGHSALGPAVARWYAVHHYPDVSDAALWTRYYHLTWGDWWTHRDTIYNDTGYRALFLLDVFMNAYLTGREDLFTDPEARKLWERLLYTIAPNGAVPHYGDTNGWSTEIGMYGFFMEYLAAKTRDGRYKYAAHRLFDYMVNHSVDIHDYHMQTDEILYGAAYMHMVADDAVKPVPPGRQSRLLTRKELKRIDLRTHKEEFGHQIYEHLLGPNEIPDKIVFKSADRDEALWAMIDVCPDAGHNSPSEPTHVAALVDQESVLTCNQGYFDETPDLHNVLLAEDLEGARFARRPMTVHVPEFYDRQYASYARVRVENYHGWPIHEERQFLFGRYRFLLLKDTVTFTDLSAVPGTAQAGAWMCRLGPCWQTQQVGPEVGSHWANTYIEHLFLSGLGLGRGIHRWKNPYWDLLVYHPEQKDCRLEVVNRFAEQPYRVLPVRLRYVWSGLAAPGQQRHWTTLLLPHEPLPKPSDLVAKVHVLADDLKLTALHLAADKYVEDWLLLNDTAGPVKAGPIETDARQLHLWVRQHQGRVVERHVLAEGATFVRFQGQAIAPAPKGQGLDSQF